MADESGKVGIPGWLRPMNKLVIALQRGGLRMGDLSLLTVPGRRSGKPRTTPVTPYAVEGRTYVLGGIPGADWVRNVRAADTVTLAQGRRRRVVRLVEVPVGEREPILREFPVKVPTGVPMMIKSGVVREGTPEEFAGLAETCTVFRVDPA